MTAEEALKVIAELHRQRFCYVCDHTPYDCSCAFEAESIEAQRVLKELAESLK